MPTRTGIFKFALINLVSKCRETSCRVLEIMASRILECQNHAGSSTFDQRAYTNMMLHPRVQALMFAHISDELKEEFSDLKSNRTGSQFHRKEESKASRYSRGERATSFQIQIEHSGVEAKEANSCRRPRDVSYMNENQPKILRSDRSSPHERINTSYRNRDIRKEGIEGLSRPNEGRVSERSLSLDSRIEFSQDRIRNPNRQNKFRREIQESVGNDTSEKMFSRIEMRYRSLDPDSHDNFVMDKVLKYRERLNQYEARRLRRQAQRLAIESGSELSQKIQPGSNLERGSQPSSSYHSDTPLLNEGRDTKAAMKSNSEEDIEKLCARVRENLAMIRYRIHSSRALLASSHGSVNDWENVQKPKIRTDGRALGMHGTPSLSVPNAIDFSEECLKPMKVSSKDNGLNEVIDRRKRGHSTKTDEKVRSRVSPKVKDTEISTAFDPFPSTIVRSLSWDDAAWRDSEFSAQPLELGKSADSSNNESNTGHTAYSSLGSDTVSSLGKVQAKNDPSDPSLPSKDKSRSNVLKAFSEIRKPLLCTKNFSDDISGEKSLTTADSSSCATGPSHKRFKKSETKKGRFSSFSRAKAPNKEWLRTSMGPESKLTRKRDIDMQKWLTAGSIIPGLDSTEAAARHGSMQMVFYDTTRGHLEGQ